MKTLLILLLVSTSLLAYEQPKVEDSKTTLDRWGHLVSFKDINISLRGLNTLQMTKNLVKINQLEIRNYGWVNVSNKEFQNTLQVVLRFK